MASKNKDGSHDPETTEEWQEAADAAYFMLCLDSAHQFGLITFEGRPEGQMSSLVKPARAIWILEEAKKRGIEPKKDFNL